MAFAHRFTGEGLVVTATPTGGSLLTLSNDYTTFGFNRQWDNVDVTAGNEIARAKLATKEDATWSLEVFGGDDETWSDFIATRTGVMTVYRHGIGDGLEYFSFNYLLEGADLSTGTADAETLSISGSRHGEMLVPYGSLQGGNIDLHFHVQPANTANDVLFPVTVRIRDGADAVITSDNSTLITITIEDNPASGALTGITAARVINGVASFLLSIDNDGSAYSLLATASGGMADVATITPVESSSFNIT